MAIADWNHRFETGIASIDAQHKTLFDMLNKLADSFRVGTSKEQTRESLDFLLKYIVEHFETEEAFMRDMGYPALTSHMTAHAQLRSKVQNLRDKQAEGEPVVVDVTVFLADWLKHHIHEVDMGYVEFVKAKNRK